MEKLKHHSKSILKMIFLKTPFLKNYIQSHDALVKAYSERFNDIGFAPGHYYSTIPALDEVEKNTLKIFDNQNIQDIDLRLSEQFNLLKQLANYYTSVPYSFVKTDLETETGDNMLKNTHPLRYTPKDAWYRYSDVIFLIAVLRHFEPKKIIEIGSGHSSAVMLDTNDIFLKNKMSFTFIEPFPEERLNPILTENDKGRVTIIKSKIQDVDVSLFKSLEENDILFIDTTHVSKVGSDVNHIFFNILPALKVGVIIHFHDIFYPFELPAKWVFEKRWFWNENYLLRAFLMNNYNYEIILFNSMLQKKFKHWFEKEMPDCLIGSEETGSIWLKKIK